MVSNKKFLIAGIVASAFVMVSLYCLWIYQKRKKCSNSSLDTSDHEKGHGIALNLFRGKLNSPKKPSVRQIDYNLLENGTNNFQEINILGKGRSGYIYRCMLDGNIEVAVKKLDDGGESTWREFENEVKLLSRIQHLNVISLLGFCIRNDARFCVYEFMQNGSLETQLHGPSNGSSLTWHIRMKIALDIAKGLEYLHEYCNPHVIHGNLKSSNILLDFNFNAKISDFGLSAINGAQIGDHIKFSGALGYLAPEYLLHGKLSDKSDVYSFGIVLLELLLGKKPVEKVEASQFQYVVTWAMPQLTDRSKLPNIIDPVIRNTMDLKYLYQVAAIAVLCIQPEPGYRPLITDVLHSLVPIVPGVLGTPKTP